MTDVITYESKNAKPNERWQAYAVLPNGEPWLVRCVGETEEIAATKARTLYETEKAKKNIFKEVSKSFVDKPISTHHLAGLVWMVNKQTGDKKRVKPEEVDNLVWAGYEKGGPRS